MRRPEQTLQIAVMRFIRAAYPSLLAFHVPNGGKRTAAEARIFKQMGVLAGVPDICIIQPNGLACFIELKASAKGKLTEDQRDFSDRAIALGCAWTCAYSVDQVADYLETLLLPFGWRPKARLAA